MKHQNATITASAVRIWARITFALVIVALGLPGQLAACRIPVFRYALERWDPSAFEVIVVAQGTLTDAQQGLVQRLRDAAIESTTPANLRVSIVDLDPTAEQEQPDNAPTHDLSAAESEAIDGLDGPAMVLRSPPKFGDEPTVWSGALNEQNVQRLIDSPLRQQIVNHLLAGDSAVWVLIESGDDAQDSKAAEALQREMTRMEEEIQLPDLAELVAEQEFQADTPVELRIGFSLLRLRRDDPAEQIFLAMLLSSEDDLVEYADKPIAIPIFGRGRTYFALVGDGINAQTIEENSRFICGDCSCQVKEQNPGSDMLFAVNWDEKVTGSAWSDGPLPELTGIGGLEIIDLGIVESSDEDVATDDTPDAADDTTKVPEPKVELADTTANSTELTMVDRESAGAAVETRPNLLPVTIGSIIAAVVFVLVGSIWFLSRQHG